MPVRTQSQFVGELFSYAGTIKTISTHILDIHRGRCCFIFILAVLMYIIVYLSFIDHII